MILKNARKEPSREKICIFVAVKLIKAIKYLASADFRLRFKQRVWRAMSNSAVGRYLLHQGFSVPAANLERDVFGMHFSSPIGLAAGFDRNGEMIDAMAAAGFGFVEIGSITPKPQYAKEKSGNLLMLKDDRAIIYRSDIESAGVERVIENVKRRKSRVVVGCNIAKNTIDLGTVYYRLGCTFRLARRRYEVS